MQSRITKTMKYYEFRFINIHICCFSYTSQYPLKKNVRYSFDDKFKALHLH